jgi:hypothetical protein
MDVLRDVRKRRSVMKRGHGHIRGDGGTTMISRDGGTRFGHIGH